MSYAILNDIIKQKICKGLLVWFLLFFIIMPLIVFIISFIFGIIVILLINKFFKKKIKKSLSLILSFTFLVLYFMLIMGGISFKYLDPQYYEFMRLCEEDKRIMYDEKLYRIYNIILNTEKLYDKQTQKEYLIDDFKLESKVVRDLGRLSEYEITHYYLNQAFYKFPSFRYRYNGIFLSGDEGGGFYLTTNDKLDCLDINGDRG